MSDELTRRAALQRIGALAASGAASGLVACTRQPRETIVPYARHPESEIPGRPRYFATCMPWPTGALGLLVESHQGRPTKIEGNPLHPASLGATDAMAQAQVFSLYDPDRSQSCLRRGAIATWGDLLEALRATLDRERTNGGAGLRLLTETVTSPTLARQIGELRALFPKAAWHQWEPVNRDHARAGALLAFGRDVSVLPDLAHAEVVVSLDDDFLDRGPASVRPMRDLAARRRVRAGATSMSRLHVAEASPSLTGAKADHRLPLPPSAIPRLALELHAALGGAAGAGGDERSHWIAAAAQDLRRAGSRALLLAGERQPPFVHWLAHHWNEKLGAIGTVGTIVAASRRLRPVEAESVAQAESLGALVDAMNGGAVELLLILGGNPARTAPADLDFAGALAKVKLRVHLSSYEDETSQRCDWHVPECHFLEAWSDALAADGTAAVVQPLIAPLWGGRTAHELVDVLLAKSQTPWECVRETWRPRLGADFERGWRRALHDGFVEGSAFADESVSAKPFEAPRPEPPAAARLELEFRADPFVHDGRFANNGWLQELPRPITKLTWENAALVSPATAAELGVASRDVVELRVGERSVHAPVWILPGQADGCLTLPLGYGRTAGGRHASGAGFDAGRLRLARAAAEPPTVTRTRATALLACPQEHDRMEGRDLARAVTLDDFEKLAQPGLPAVHEAHAEPATLLPPVERGDHAWAMVIDLGACTGCNACVAACQAENNIAIVGKEEVARGRSLHWIRVDRYFDGDERRPAIRHQPVPCMHCENAPCEVVCPVGATVHDSEGLNEMIYNRCVGTRYCGNNCPYKVRRFNFLAYVDYGSESLALQRNPDVTVRSRGVMEKCTYCVQRINEAKLAARRDDRPLKDGDVRTACQMVCPAQAIVFGDLQDPASAVTKLQPEPHRYALLGELGTKPRTTYLAAVSNPRPAG